MHFANASTMARSMNTKDRAESEHKSSTMVLLMKDSGCLDYGMDLVSYYFDKPLKSCRDRHNKGWLQM